MFPEKVSTIHNYFQYLDIADQKTLDTNNITKHDISNLAWKVAENLKGIPFFMLIRMPSFICYS